MEDKEGRNKFSRQSFNPPPPYREGNRQQQQYYGWNFNLGGGVENALMESCI